MKNIVTIAELKNHVDGEVTLRGWLYSRRSSGKVAFLVVRDGTGMCQCVVEAAIGEGFQAAQDLAQESSLTVTGKVRREDRAPGGFELAVTGLTCLNLAQEYPITPKAHGIDFLMQHRHLWLRSRRPTVILRVRATVIKACRDFFDENGFTLIDTPILVSGAGEDAQTLFPVEYFDRKAFLAQTGQLYLESACMALGKVYCFGPTFRAEKSKTRRHLTEFWMIEPEVAFAELPDVMALAEDLICFVTARVLEKHREDLVFLGRDPAKLEAIKKPFERLTYSQAAEMLRSPAIKARLEKEIENDREKLAVMVKELEGLEKQLAGAKKGWQADKAAARIAEVREEMLDLEADLANKPKHIELAQGFEWGKDLGGSDETIISRSFEKPVFVTHYPRQAKAFYMKVCKKDPRVVLNVDLLAPEGYGEIIGGSQREEDLAVMEGRMKETGLSPDDYGWYMDTRKYGSVPHGGFGLGIERFLCWLCGIKHVREAIPFPRTMGRMSP
jgi:asparaginyl-tRNA synthetase